MNSLTSRDGQGWWRRWLLLLLLLLFVVVVMVVVVVEERMGGSISYLRSVVFEIVCLEMKIRCLDLFLFSDCVLDMNER